MPSAVVSLVKTKYRPPSCGGGLPTTKVRISRSFISGAHAHAGGIIRANGEPLRRPPLADDLDLKPGARARDRRGNVAEGERAPHPMAICAGSDPAAPPAVMPDRLIADRIGIAISAQRKGDETQLATARALLRHRRAADEIALLQDDETAETRLMRAIDGAKLPRPVTEALLNPHGIEGPRSEGFCT